MSSEWLPPLLLPSLYVVWVNVSHIREVIVQFFSLIFGCKGEFGHLNIPPSQSLLTEADQWFGQIVRFYASKFMAWHWWIKASTEIHLTYVMLTANNLKSANMYWSALERRLFVSNYEFFLLTVHLCCLIYKVAILLLTCCSITKIRT